MAEPSESLHNNPDHMSGIRRANDTDRSAEFKDARDQLARKISSTLDDLTLKAESGEPLANGEVIKPGIGVEKHIIHDPTEERPRLALGYTTKPEPGAYMISDDTGLRRFSLVEANGRVVEIEDNTLEKALYGPELGYSTWSQSKLSRFKEELPDGGYTEVNIDASGALSHKFFDAVNGFHSGIEVRTVDDVQMLDSHFDQVIGELFSASGN